MAGAPEPSTHAGRAKTYEALHSNSLEDVTTADALATELRFENVAPTRIWKLLEHGEKVECLVCIPRVAKLLYNSHPKTREISAWWLRRRIFGVFGKGEVYSQVLATLSDPKQADAKRAFAANALGEFLNPAAVRHVAKAALNDVSPRVRAASVAALQRLNSEGPAQELGAALADPDEAVRLAALRAAMSVNVFSSSESLVLRLSDPSALVRRRTAEVIGAMRLSDTVVGLAELTRESREPNADVRSAAVWALGQIADSKTRPSVEAARSDSSPLVRNSADIALRRL
jgi:hypothetical protein